MEQNGSYPPPERQIQQQFAVFADNLFGTEKTPLLQQYLLGIVCWHPVRCLLNL
ncbi:hypothetical protein DGWBC_1271 [Dehalogenimonas sp. WBC-2]|nr:hypothetical protein DGWBC_1271 [Dehalogenimonas sp. WBC-2]